MGPIVVAGGCYFETCEAPHWRALYGSGGRAAHALVGQVPVTLHTYFPKARRQDLSPLVAAGVDVKAADSATALAFAYFHPLSQPVLAPERSSISQQPPLRVEGPTILRFGFVEGDAIVAGRRVVYDPQSVGDFAPFCQNGSSAEALALVLNADELRAATGQDDLGVGARVLLDAGAEVVIAKAGVEGAVVHTRESTSVKVPAFWSNAIFKIGTGDVFSAAFTHAWGHLGQDPISAAYTASRSVAHYTANRTSTLPPENMLAVGCPVGARAGVVVNLIGSTARLADRWLFEEAAWCLKQLGSEVHRWDAAPDAPLDEGGYLVLADQIDPNRLAKIVARLDRKKLVILSEAGVTVSPDVRQTADFTTALYWACWVG